MRDSISFYKEAISKCKKNIKEIESKSTIFSVLRLVIFVEWAIMAYNAFKSDNVNLLIFSTAINAVIFLILVAFHNKHLEKQNREEILININKEAIARKNFKWKKFEDKGEEYLEEEHAFSNDLDIFGNSSLFQWINTTKTIYGREALAKRLKLNKNITKEDILKTQKAVKELGEKVEFRQEVMLEGEINKRGVDNGIGILKWAKERDDVLISANFKFISYLVPVIVLASIIFSFVLKFIPVSIPVLLILFNYVFIRKESERIDGFLNVLGEGKNKLAAYRNIAEIIENEDFESEELRNLKSKLSSSGKKASVQLKELENLCGMIFDRGNAFYIIFNLAILWDYHLMTNLEVWRRKNGDDLEGWLNVIGEIEAIAALSNIYYDYDDYTFPEFNDEWVVKADNVGHPMLGEVAVKNDFEFQSKKGTILITGSNMSGKSTFLRTIGVNLVFAYLGLPVRADRFNASIMRIYTCMRTKDNLEESISSFYAEILRVKSIIEAANRGEKVFFLLDEIFKGTNSRDRHTGAKILIKQLNDTGAKGFVSTHDLELCDLEESDNRIKNYHFREYYENNEIKFDYKLRDGKSTTQNAIYLMKMAGIEM